MYPDSLREGFIESDVGVGYIFGIIKTIRKGNEGMYSLYFAFDFDSTIQCFLCDNQELTQMHSELVRSKVPFESLVQRYTSDGCTSQSRLGPNQGSVYLSKLGYGLMLGQRSRVLSDLSQQVYSTLEFFPVDYDAGCLFDSANSEDDTSENIFSVSAAIDDSSGVRPLPGRWPSILNHQTKRDGVGLCDSLHDTALRYVGNETTSFSWTPVMEESLGKANNSSAEALAIHDEPHPTWFESVTIDVEAMFEGYDFPEDPKAKSRISCSNT